MKYVIDGNEIVLDTAYINVLNEFESFVVSQMQQYDQIYQEEINSFDEMLEKVPDLALDFIILSLEFCVSKLVQNGILNCSVETLMDEYYEELELGFLDEFFGILQPYFDVSLKQIEERYSRNLKKELRGRWSGGGFGVKGAVKGALTAEALNIGSGLAYDIKNSISNFCGSIKVERMKNKIFNDRNIFRSIRNLVFKYCMYSREICCEKNNFSGQKFNKSEAYAIYKNAVQYLKNDDKNLISQICKAIESYPFEIKFYNKIYDITGGSPMLTKLVKNVGLLELFVEHVMGEHLTSIPKTIEEINRLINELQEYQITKKANSCGFDYSKRIRLLMQEKEHIEKIKRQQEIEKEKIARKEQEERQRAQEEKRKKMEQSFKKISEYVDSGNLVEARKCLDNANELEDGCWRKEWLEYRLNLRKVNTKTSAEEGTLSIQTIVKKSQNEGEKEILLPLLEEEVHRFVKVNNHNKKIDNILELLLSMNNNNYEYWLWKFYLSVDTAVSNKAHLFLETQQKYLLKIKELGSGRNVKQEIIDFLCEKKMEYIQLLKCENRDMVRRDDVLVHNIKSEKKNKIRNSLGVCVLIMLLIDSIALPVIYFVSKVVLAIVLHYFNEPIIAMIGLFLWFGISILALDLGYHMAFDSRSTVWRIEERITSSKDEMERHQRLIKRNEEIIEAIPQNFEEAEKWINKNLV